MEDRANILRQMKVCRFCLSNEEKDLLNIHDRQPQNPDVSTPLPSLSLQVMACIAIEVVRNDAMPQYICKNCRHLTTQAYIFKTNCKKADDALKLFLVTGQLSKPYLQNVIQIKVQPTTDKFIRVVEEVENIERMQSADKESQMEFEELNPESEQGDEIDDTFVEESLESTNTQPNASVETLETFCFPCDQCDRSFPLKQLLDLHMTKHNRERNFECEVCNNKFYNKYDLQKHMLVHNAVKEFACVVCNKTFNREAFLRRHEKIHEDAPKFCCTQCDKTFLTKEYLDYHIQKHKKKRPFTCKICNKSFVFKQGLERHEIVHSENKPHKCNYCEASFISAIKLTRHITSHAGLRPYPCKLCGRTFLLSHHLTRHMRSHYAASSNDASLGQYKCDICSMSFRRKDSLINHSAIHSMVNLKCVICNTTFETAKLVKEHITTHLSSLPFPCEKCDYSFDTEEQLEEHELKHAEMEYEEQIEKEVFSEALEQSFAQQYGDEEEEEEEVVEDGEVTEYTIMDLNNPGLSLRPTYQATNERTVKKDTNRSRIEFLKDELDTEEETEKGIVEEDEVIEIEPIKPIVRQEGTKVYRRKSSPVGSQSEIRLSSLITSQTRKMQSGATSENISTDLNTNKTMKMGEKVVKVQKFILTKEEMKAMAKQGILEVKGGQVVLKAGGQQIINATMKSIQKNEIDSLLDKRSANRMQLKKYEKKSSSGDVGESINV